jgi:hypothetical protein
VHTKKFHGYWDFDAVNALLPQLAATISKYARRKQIDAAKGELIYEMASHEPKDWRMPPQLDVKAYAEAWADQILPIAREAHERLQFADVKPLREDDGRIVASGDARERLSADGPAYRDWAKNVVREELHKAGWRLADLLEKTLRSTGVATTMSNVGSSPVGQERTPGSDAVDDVRQTSYGEFHASYK